MSRTARELNNIFQGTVVVPAVLTHCAFFVISSDFCKLANVLDRAITHVLDRIEQHGIRPAKACRICIGTGVDSIAVWNELFAPLHRACLEEEIQSAADAIDENEYVGSYISGTAGALLGAFLSCIPVMFVIDGLVFIYISILIPICAYQGYRLFNVKMNKYALLVTIFASFLSVYFIRPLIDALNLLSQSGVMFSEGYMYYLSRNFSSFKGFFATTKDYLPYFLSIGFGIYFAWASISWSNKRVQRDMEFVSNSIIPYTPWDENL
jgi:hypothetical protein